MGLDPEDGAKRAPTVFRTERWRAPRDSVSAVAGEDLRPGRVATVGVLIVTPFLWIAEAAQKDMSDSTDKKKVKRWWADNPMTYGLDHGGVTCAT